MKMEYVPRKYADTYIGTVGRLYFLYNPASPEGISLLAPEAFYIYNLIDGKKSIAALCRQQQALHPEFPTEKLQAVIEHLAAKNFLFFNREDLAGSAIPQAHPETLLVWFHITNQCNLRCTYCWVAKSPEKMDIRMIRTSLTRLFAAAKKEGFVTIQFNFAGGEPLLEMRNLEETIKYATELGEKYNLNAKFSIITNGVLLTEKVARFLKKHDVETVISFDGLGRFHDRNRTFVDGTGSFKYMIKALDTAQDRGVLSGVMATITKDNVSHVTHLTKYLIDRGIHKFRFHPFLDNPQAVGNLRPDDGRLIKQLKAAYSLAYRHIPGFSLRNSLLYQLHLTHPQVECEAGRSLIALLPGGNISSCSYTLEEPVASVHDKDIFKTIGQNNSIKPVTSQPGNNECKKCKWRFVCTSCPVFSRGKKNEYCEVYKALIPHILKLEAEKMVKGSRLISSAKAHLS